MLALVLAALLASMQAEAPAAIAVDPPPSDSSAAIPEVIAGSAPAADDLGRVRIILSPLGLVVLDAPLSSDLVLLALPPGSYRVEWQGAAGTGAQEIELRDGTSQAVDAAHLALRGATFSLMPPSSELSRDRSEKKDPGARAELVLYQTLHGIGLGIEACTYFECDNVKVGVSVPTLAGGATLTAALFASSGGIKPGQTLAINTGTSWGFWNAIAMTAISDRIEGHKEVVTTLVLGQALGLGGGTLAALFLEPKAGDVAFADAMGTWAGVLTLFAHGANEWRGSSDMKWWTVLGATDAAFIAAALLGPQMSMTRGRTLVVDAGGILGMLTGMGAALVFEWTSSTGEFFGSAIAGTVLGLGLTTYLTQDWDVPEVPAQVMIVPTDGGGMALVGLRL